MYKNDINRLLYVYSFTFLAFLFLFLISPLVVKIGKGKIVEGWGLRAKGRNAYFWFQPKPICSTIALWGFTNTWVVITQRDLSMEAFTVMGKYFHFQIWKWSKHILFSSDNGIHSESQIVASMCIVISHLAAEVKCDQCEISCVFSLAARMLLVDEGGRDLLRLSSWFPQRAETVLSSLLPSPQGCFTETVTCISCWKETDSLLNWIHRWK